MLPYFDVLLEELRKGNAVAREALGEHVHVGYWKNPAAAAKDATSYNHAAELMLRKALEKAGLKDNSRILDVGCGLGGTLKLLNNEYKDCTLVGVNLDERQLVIARNTVTPRNGNTISFVHADACALPFDSASFDTVLCVESIFHFPSRKIFLSECQRVLKPDGQLTISDFVPMWGAGWVLDTFERIFGIVGEAYGTLHINISLPAYRKLARASGFGAPRFEDITTNTLPTYPAFKKNFNSIGNRKKKSELMRATSLIELGSRIGLVRYLILSFQKQPFT